MNKSTPFQNFSDEVYFFAFFGPKRLLMSSGIVRELSVCFAQNGTLPPLMREERQIFVQNLISSPFGSEKRKNGLPAVRKETEARKKFFKNVPFCLPSRLPDRGYAQKRTSCHKNGRSVTAVAIT